MESALYVIQAIVVSESEMSQLVRDNTVPAHFPV